MGQRFRILGAYILSFIMLVSCLSGCGDNGKPDSASEGSGVFSTESSANSELSGSGAELEGVFSDDANLESKLTWTDTQFYNGEAIDLWRAPGASDEKQDKQDIYLYDSKNNRKKVVSGAPNTYTGDWFITQEGFCLSTLGNKLARIETDGTESFCVNIEGGVKNICQLEDGEIVLLIKTAEDFYSLATLNSESGEYKKVEGMNLGKDNRLYISAGEEGVVLLRSDGFWDVNLETGELVCRIPMSEYDFKVPYVLEAFQMAGGGCVELLYAGSSSMLLPKDVEKYRTVITVQNSGRNDWLQAQLDKFNQSNHEYYAELLNFDSPTSQVNSEEDMLNALSEGVGPDVIMGSCFSSDVDVLEAIEKGYLEEIGQYMEESGIYVEDYFPTIFEMYRYENGIYGASLNMETTGLVFSKKVLGGRVIEDVESLVDALLAYTEPATMSVPPSNVLWYFLRASESVCGTVDWENMTCDFQGDLFAKLLEVSLLYGSDGSEDTRPVIQRSEATFGFYHFLNEEQLQLAGEVYLGYVFDDGLYPGVLSSFVVHMNSNSKEKKGAWAVMAYLLSEEAQQQEGLVTKGKGGSEDSPLVVRYCPANIFAFDAVVLTEMEETALVKYKTMSGGTVSHYKAGWTQEDATLTDDEYRARYNLKEADVEEMQKRMYNARIFPAKTEPIQVIIFEEAKSYFTGERSLGDTCDVIEERVQAYLDQQRSNAQ